MRPDLSLIGSWYHGYISLVPEDNLAEAFTIVSNWKLS